MEHNISIDKKIRGAKLLRTDLPISFESTKNHEQWSFIQRTIKTPGLYGYKWHTLSELHIKLFGQDFEDAHHVLVDISLTEKCFWELRNRGVI